jgi:phytoene dehydrogenase-like protein
LAEALASAARQHGADIRMEAEVAQILMKEDGAAPRALGVALQNGDVLNAWLVASSADPRRTFFQLLDPLAFDTELVRVIKNFRYKGAVAKVNLALSELPHFTAAPGDRALAHLRGAISISPSLDYLERAYDAAKYRGLSPQPYLEAVIPSLLDPSRAPEGQHVMSVWMQYAPYHLEGGWTDEKREQLGNLVVDTLAQYAPNLKRAILYRQVLTPVDIERQYGLTEGNVFHGEITLDQLFFMRPAPGWAQYATPVEGLYLCGSGTHPAGALVPGRNAARQILQDLRAKR